MQDPQHGSAPYTFPWVLDECRCYAASSAYTFTLHLTKEAVTYVAPDGGQCL